MTCRSDYSRCMPTKQRIEDFIAAVMTNNHDEAVAAFYTEDASGFA